MEPKISTLERPTPPRKTSDQDSDGINQLKHRAWDQFISAKGRRYRSCRFENYECKTEQHEKAKTAIEKYSEKSVENIRKGKSILLMGPCGVGKDHLLTALVFQSISQGAFIPNGHKGSMVPVGYKPIIWSSGVTLLTKLTDRFTNDETAKEVLNPLFHCKLLVLSDPVQPGFQVTRNERRGLFELLEHRVNNILPTWMSINVESREQLNELVGADVADRMVYDALVIGINAESHRKASEVVM